MVFDKNEKKKEMKKALGLKIKKQFMGSYSQVAS